jgi:hypothetical protein
MKFILFFAIHLISVGVSAQDESVEPLAVVNARMNAYNMHDINAFLKNYSEDIQVYTYPNIALGQKGKGHLKSIFDPMFKEGKVSVKIHQQITQGDYVINHETVNYNGNSQKYVSIYEVHGGLITSVQFVRE